MAIPDLIPRLDLTPIPRIALLIVAMLLVGCGSSPAQSVPATTASVATTSRNPEPPIATEKLHYFGVDWIRGQPHSDGLRAGWIYTCDDPFKRLILFDRPAMENQYRAMARVQVTLNDGESWIDHGPERLWAVDGRYHDCRNVLGEFDGVEFVWDGKGQLEFRRSYVLGKSHGLQEGWYGNGQKQYEAIYRDGKELSGAVWNEDGTRIR